MPGTATQDALSVEPYDPDTSTPKAVIVTIDGILEPPNGDGTYGWEEPGHIRLRDALEAALAAFYLASFEVVIVSALPAECRPQIEQWLRVRKVRYDALLMRGPGENLAADQATKLALFNRIARRRYNVVAVLDDHDRSVAMWRSLGIPCFQVAPAEF